MKKIMGSSLEKTGNYISSLSSSVQAISDVTPSQIPNLFLWMDPTVSSSILTNGAVSFTSADGQFLSGPTGGLNHGTNFAVCFWVNLATVPVGNMSLVTKNDGTDGGYSIYVLAGVPVFEVYGLLGLSVGTATSLTTLTANTWYFIRAEYNAAGNSIVLGVNESDIQVGTLSAPAADSNSAEFEVGAQNTAPANYLNGRIDSLGVWNANLTNQQKIDVYNSGTGVAFNTLTLACFTNLVSWWDFNQLSGQRIDSMGANTLTDGGSTPSGFFTGKVTHPAINGNTVCQWNDQSGNSRHFIQNTGANRPSFVILSPIGAKPALLFDATDDFMEQASARTLGNAFTCFAIVRYGSLARAFLYCGDVDTMSIELGGGFYETWDGTNYTNWSTTGVASKTNYGYAMNNANNPQTTLLLRNGTLRTPLASSGTSFNSFNIFSLGRRTGVAGFFWSGHICETMIYSRSLNPVEMIQIRNYLQAKWGVS